MFLSGIVLRIQLILSERQEYDPLSRNIVHMWEDVDLVADGKNRRGVISLFEDKKSGESEIHIGGRGSWFSVGDPDMDMKIHPSNIDLITGYSDSITFFLKDMKFRNVDVHFKNKMVRDKCYELVCCLIEKHKEQLILLEKLRAKYRMGDLSDISPLDFEKLVGELYEKLGYKVTHVGRGGDEGIDLCCTNMNTRQTLVIQCKRYQKVVGTPELRNFIGAIAGNHYGASKGVFVTTSSYSRDAQMLANRSNIILINGDQLTELLRKYY